MNVREGLKYVVKVYSGEESDLLGGIYSLIRDLPKTIVIIKDEKFSNFYTYIDDYSELAQTLVSDDLLWENKDKESDEFYKVLKSNEGEEEVLKEYLNKRNWFVSNGLAIVLDDDVMAEVTVTHDEELSDFKERVEEALDYDQSDYLLAGLFSITGDFELAVDIVINRDYFGYYADVHDYKGLADSLLSDENLWTDIDVDPKSKEMQEFLKENQQNEEALEKYLKEGGWVINSELAICRDFTA